MEANPLFEYDAVMETDLSSVVASDNMDVNFDEGMSLPRNCSLFQRALGDPPTLTVSYRDHRGIARQ